MKNPFSDFKNYSSAGPLSGEGNFSRQERKSKILHLVELFEKLKTTEIPDSGFLVDHGTVTSIHKKSSGLLATYDASAHDIEEFTYGLIANQDSSFKDPFFAGIFVSALMEASSRSHFFLELPSSSPTIHFLGYRLSRGKLLQIDGNVGDFLGASLTGGTIIVNGNARDWVASGMNSGKIEINGSCGRFAGEWMRGGTLVVRDSIASVGHEARGEIIRGRKPDGN